MTESESRAHSIYPPEGLAPRIVVAVEMCRTLGVYFLFCEDGLERVSQDDWERARILESH